MAEPSSSRRPPTPRWVKVFCAVAVAVVVLFALLHLTGVGGLGPGMHSGGH